MKLPRLRFTVRRLMVAVAVISLMLGAETARRRWYYLKGEAGFARQARNFKRYASQSRARGEHHLAEIHEAEANRMDRLSREYRRAANTPWSPPPENELLPD
jgi:hypothetical protein